VAIALLVGTLVAVVVAHTMLASSQVRLSDAQSAVTAEQATHQQLAIDVARREAPGWISGEAAAQHMSVPTAVGQLPYVPLNVALPTPKVTAPPAAPPPPSTSTSLATSNSSSTSTLGTAGNASTTGNGAGTATNGTAGNGSTSTGAGTTSTNGTATGQ
jgi:hypothetical protein